MRINNLLGLDNLIILFGIILFGFKQIVRCDPFTYQNDLRILQISLVNILTGSNVNQCSQGTFPSSFSVPVVFAQSFSSLPQVALSIQHFKGTELNNLGFSVTAPLNKITMNGFEIAVTCQLDSTLDILTTLKVQYIATILENVEIFSKSYAAVTLANLSTGNLYREYSEQITYTKPKSEIPTVYAFLTGFKLNKGGYKRFLLKAEITDIKLTKFTILLSTNLDCTCSFASVQFVAFWATEASHALLPTTTNSDSRKDPIAYPYYGFYSDYLNTNQTAINVFFGISQFDLGTFNPTQPLIGPDVKVENELKVPTFTGKEYYFQVGSTSGTRNYETFLPWIIFLLKRCPANEYLHSNYLCSLLCPFGTYKEIVKFVGICSNCHITCQECYGAGINQCVSCVFPSRKFTTNTCICANGYYQGTIAQKNCLECSTKCETCINSADNCSSCKGNRELASNCKCPKGYWEQGVFEVCPSCFRTCSECTNGDQNACTSCKITYSMDNGQCICSKGQFDDMTKNSCSPCHSSCDTCNGPTDQDCLTCSTTAFRSLVQGRQCLCNIGYHEENNVCIQDAKLQCIPYCETCKDTKICQTCVTGRILIANSCICPEGYYHNIEKSICSKCHSQCKGCSGPSIYECVSCFSDRVYQSGQCNSTSSSNDRSLNIPLLVVICILAVLLVIFIPFVMRWTYYFSRKLWLRKRILADFLDQRAKDREDRIQKGVEADIIVHEPIILNTSPDDDSILDQSNRELNGFIHNDSRIRTPQQVNIRPKSQRLSELQILSPSNGNPHLQILSPSNNMNSTQRMNDSFLKSPQNGNSSILSPMSSNVRNNQQAPSSRMMMFDQTANAGKKRLPKINKQ